MKLLMIIYSGMSPSRISSLFESHHVAGWTELDHAHGAGATGRREGTRAWPGESSLFFTATDDDRIADLTHALREEKERLEEGERLHVMTLPVDNFF